MDGRNDGELNQQIRERQKKPDDISNCDSHTVTPSPPVASKCTVGFRTRRSGAQIAEISAARKRYRRRHFHSSVFGRNSTEISSRFRRMDLRNVARCFRLLFHSFLFLSFYLDLKGNYPHIYPTSGLHGVKIASTPLILICC